MTRSGRKPRCCAIGAPGAAISDRAPILDAPQEGPVKAELSESGLLLDVDISAVDARCTGKLSLHYKDAIPTDVLMR